MDKGGKGEGTVSGMGGLERKGRRKECRVQREGETISNSRENGDKKKRWMRGNRMKKTLNRDGKR